MLPCCSLLSTFNGLVSDHQARQRICGICAMATWISLKIMYRQIHWIIIVSMGDIGGMVYPKNKTKSIPPEWPGVSENVWDRYIDYIDPIFRHTHLYPFIQPFISIYRYIYRLSLRSPSLLWAPAIPSHLPGAALCWVSWVSWGSWEGQLHIAMLTDTKGIQGLNRMLATLETPQKGNHE